MDFPAGTVVKNLLANTRGTRNTCSIPQSERFCEARNGNPLQYPCLENSMDFPMEFSGKFQTTVYGVAKNWAQLST